jgi:Domain of unknown function (DUF4136)
MEARMKIGRLAALALVMSTAAAYAQKVNVDSDPAAPFATYKTYAWTAGTPAPVALSEQRLHVAVDARLAGEGLAMNTTAPDLIVSTHVTTKDKQELIANGFGYGPWGFGGGFGGASVETFVEGTLVVNLYDAKTKKMVWRGVATATASDKPTKNTEKMNKALDKMFEKYPGAGAPSN